MIRQFGMAIAAALLLAGSAAAHELPFSLQHNHNYHYYENLRYQEHRRNQMIWTTTNRLPYYMRYGANGDRTVNLRVSPRTTRSSGVRSLR